MGFVTVLPISSLKLAPNRSALFGFVNISRRAAGALVAPDARPATLDAYFM